MLIKYTMFDPSGNITALVESNVAFEDRKKIADYIMNSEPDCEQVGFVSAFKDGIRLEMTGGEFCGNATLCAGIMNGKESNAVYTCEGRLLVNVYELSERSFECNLTVNELPAGIEHHVMEGPVPEKQIAEKQIKGMKLGQSNAIGFMYLDGNHLTPLVYVPGADTLFWENSCASGSMAVGKYLYEKTQKDVDIDLFQPSGIIKVCVNRCGISLGEKIKLIKQTSIHYEGTL